MSKDPIRFRLTIYLIVFLAVLIGGTVGFKVVENKSWIDAFYFIIVTMATVGYGDVHPVTAEGKIFTIFLIVLGVGTFLGVVANAMEMMLSRRDKQVRMNKMNMVIGVFFSEVGIKLIRAFSDADPNFEEIQKGLMVTEKWTHQDFLAVSRHLKNFQYGIEISKINLASLKDYLLRQRDFLVGLLENPILLEHEFFTDLLRAVFHLAEEPVLPGRPDPAARHGYRPHRRGYESGLSLGGPSMGRLYGTFKSQLPLSLLAGHEDQPL